MKKLLTASVIGAALAVAPVAAAGVASAECPVSQLCGPESQAYPGDQNGRAYSAELEAWGSHGWTVAKADKLGRTICKIRAQGRTGEQMIDYFMADTGASYGLAVNVVAMGEYHYCPEYYDVG